MNIGATGNTFFNRASGLVIPEISLPGDAVQSFAQEIARRSAQTQPGAERSVDQAGLTSAVADAVGYVKDNYGSTAARAVMGLVLGGSPADAVSEDELGQGFVNALKFIDRNFGVAEGDKAMAYFNGNLNHSLNGFFQNGSEEDFLAVDPQAAASGVAQAAGSAVGAVMEKFQGGSAQSLYADLPTVDQDGARAKPFADQMAEMAAQARESGQGTVPDGTSQAAYSRVARSVVPGYAARPVQPGAVLDARA